MTFLHIEYSIFKIWSLFNENWKPWLYWRYGNKDKNKKKVGSSVNQNITTEQKLCFHAAFSVHNEVEKLKGEIKVRTLLLSKSKSKPYPFKKLNDLCSGPSVVLSLFLTQFNWFRLRLDICSKVGLYCNRMWEDEHVKMLYILSSIVGIFYSAFLSGDYITL